MKKLRSIFFKAIFKIRHNNALAFIYLKVLKLYGLDSKSTIPCSTKFTWPHKVKIGKNTYLEHDIFFKHDGPYTSGNSILIGNNVFIGNHCEFNIAASILIEDNVLIASGCKFIDHDHGIESNQLIRTQRGLNKPITIEQDVWIGCNSVILKGVKIGHGTIIGAGSIVTKSIPSNEIWAGVPAKLIKKR
ncbi:galactoside acetyltransferase (LacA) [Pseudopedobacter saltans DSM 12145]|uniref:Galactoside acetyltransferase (LacA) n=1 Tax=Pseudopedobacter saltans (strain ATCC 51119 / DSM 12145 / JCM 21818 / CCUG 39354 / LMG 10337 / NBRC 100064 / NCIMB 13643) TaxID=762903 RepID=F0SD87_PSESL|nr:acyltransferase [Pseudopedobacter saltans]ADY52873.1 galactoside acetyltransferase (LacA) [Pseudopedobacter saltans DSM 12145]